MRPISQAALTPAVLGVLLLCCSFKLFTVNGIIKN